MLENKQTKTETNKIEQKTTAQTMAGPCRVAQGMKGRARSIGKKRNANPYLGLVPLLW